MQVLPSALTGEQIGQIRRDLAAAQATGERWAETRAGAC